MRIGIAGLMCALVAAAFVESAAALGGSGTRTITTFAGNGGYGYSGDGGPARNAELSSAVGLATFTCPII